MTTLLENSPELWHSFFPFPQTDSHKYSRGTALIRGGAVMTGAARLAARAAQRMGAGLVTLAAPMSVLPIYASALESVIVRPCDDLHTWQEMVSDARHPALCIGPGLGAGMARAAEVDVTLAAKRATVLDADALTPFGNEPAVFFKKLHGDCVLTPHEGEFLRLFGTRTGDKPRRALQAAEQAGCVLVLKGAETVIATPDGRAIVNHNAPPWLATAGSGDVLAGMILGLIAQKMEPVWAAAAAVWMHGRVATDQGPGLIAEDIVAKIPDVLQEILNNQGAK